ncbi:MAG: CvpA family protein [Calditrichaeota bacterium]|nr:MAG: CvpA family protein [Calditrichota bacterium]
MGDQVNYLDYIIVSVVAVFAVKGLVKGFFQEVFGLVGLVVALMLSTKYMSNTAHWIDRWLTVPPAVSTLLGFVVIFGGVVLAAQVLSHLLQKVARAAFLGWLEKLSGAAVGFLKGAVVMSLLLLLISILPFGDLIVPGQKESRLFLPTRNFAPRLFDLISEVFPGSKSFYSELRESLRGAAAQDLGRETRRFLKTLPNDDDTRKQRSNDE